MLIQALCKKLGNIKPKELEAAIDGMPTQKKMDELEAKNNFLLETANKLRADLKADLKETREDHHKAVDKLNAALQFNQKLEEYVSNPGDVVNKAKLFDKNLARNPVSAGKVIPVLVDFAKKMEELLDEMRVLFDGLTLEVPPVAAENLHDISGEIPSLNARQHQQKHQPDRISKDLPSRQGRRRRRLN